MSFSVRNYGQVMIDNALNITYITSSDDLNLRQSADIGTFVKCHFDKILRR